VSGRVDCPNRLVVGVSVVDLSTAVRGGRDSSHRQPGRVVPSRPLVSIVYGSETVHAQFLLASLFTVDREDSYYLLLTVPCGCRRSHLSTV
jgi:hypothetical protein